MEKPLIAIAGSAEANRIYEPPLANIAQAKQAAENLGAALAAAGHRIIVYASYIEGDVVRGFVKSGKGAQKSIIVQYATGQTGAEAFPEYTTHSDLFEPQQDDSEEWEMSFYRSLGQADGVILIGGGRSTLITGVIALAYRIPLVALARYGGSALKVWKSLKSGRNLATETDVNTMAQEGTAAMAKAWVKSIEAQMKVREIEKREHNSRWASLSTLLLLAGWVVLIPIGDWLLPKNAPGVGVPFAFKLILFVAPMIAGASGATIRAIMPEGGELTFRTTIKGVAAGVICAVLYLAAQLVSNPAPNTTVLIFAEAFGFIAGFTFDRVFKKLETVNTLHLSSLEKKGKNS
jgi:hypothetical protein